VALGDQHAADREHRIEMAGGGCASDKNLHVTFHSVCRNKECCRIIARRLGS
jgi:hypothetical protein